MNTQKAIEELKRRGINTDALKDAEAVFNREMGNQTGSLATLSLHSKEAFADAVKAQLAFLTTAQKVSVLAIVQRDLASGTGPCDLVLVITSLEIGIRSLNAWAAAKAHGVIPEVQLNVSSAMRIAGGH